MLTPAAFEMPEKYSQWREGQLDAVEVMAEPLKGERFRVICAPTGFGKSLAYEAAAKLYGKRTVTCTSTKGLQDQLATDFGQMPGTVDIRGQSNYKCKQAPQFGIPGHVTVEMAPCHVGAKCDSKFNGECEYFAKYEEARRTKGVIHTNYALWMTDRWRRPDKEGRGGDLKVYQPVDMLILDEAHDAVDQLADHVGTEIRYSGVSRCGLTWPSFGDGDEDLQGWRKWAAGGVNALELKIARSNSYTNLTEVMRWRGLHRELQKVAGMKGQWIMELPKDWETRQYGPRARFSPLWPKDYAESVLFRDTPRVILISATVRPKTLELLGVPPTAAIFKEYPSSFPLTSRPIIHVPTVQMNWRTSDLKLREWINRMDLLLDSRSDRKGIIHTVSYERAQLILDNSRHKSRLISHSSKDRASIVADFKSSKLPLVLVSPSVDTGYDFPYTQCEFQIIGKLPFPDSKAKVVKARMKADPGWSNYTTAQTLVQMTGRGMRAEDDRCETLIVDDNIQWFLNQNEHHFPEWWLQSYRGERRWGAMPEPLPKLK